MNFRSLWLAPLLLSAAPVVAQNAPKAPGGFTYFGVNAIYRQNGVRLEGTLSQPAYVRSPELDVTAQVIAFDLESGAQTGLREVRAQNGVSLKLNISPRAGGAPARVEATCKNATLTPRDRKLVLSGNVSGFYQVGKGAKNVLAGEVATLRFAANSVDAALESSVGGKPVQITLAPEPGDKANSFGTITLSGRSAAFNQSDGTARLAGNARAVSSGGPNNFDVAAPEMAATRAADGTLSSLKTTGRTLVKLDLPPDPTPVPAPAATVNGAAVSKPTHVEVAADGATIDRATQTLIFEGNVQGFYRLQPAGGAAQNYNFSGTRAVVRYAETPAGTLAAGLNVQVTQAKIDAPALDLGF